MCASGRSGISSGELGSPASSRSRLGRGFASEYVVGVVRLDVAGRDRRAGVVVLVDEADLCVRYRVLCDTDAEFVSRGNGSGIDGHVQFLDHACAGRTLGPGQDVCDVF